MENLKNIIDKSKIMEQVSLKKYTTMKVGGTAKKMVFPSTQEEIIAVIRFCIENNIRFFILGCGSNLIFDDVDFAWIFINLINFNSVNCLDNSIEADAGAKLSQIAGKAYDHALTGFEFASGIPGTLGGAVFMNAGAYGGEMKDVILETTAVDMNGRKLCLQLEDQDFGYRTSCFKEKKRIILSSKIQLHPGQKSKILHIMQTLNKKRKAKQPLNYPSAGSIFKRPVGYYTGALIESSNLKGFSIGDALISEKHAGFIVNKGNATANDIRKLIAHIQEIVFQNFSIELEPEVRIITNN